MVIAKSRQLKVRLAECLETDSTVSTSAWPWLSEMVDDGKARAVGLAEFFAEPGTMLARGVAYVEVDTGEVKATAIGVATGYATSMRITRQGEFVAQSNELNLLVTTACDLIGFSAFLK